MLVFSQIDFQFALLEYNIPSYNINFFMPAINWSLNKHVNKKMISWNASS